MTREIFSVSIDDSGDGMAIRCSGELDLSTREELRRAVDSCLEAGPLFLHVDCRAVTFMACAGLDTLLYAQARCRASHTALRVSLSAAGERLLQVLECSELEGLDETRKTRRTVRGYSGGLRAGWPPGTIFRQELSVWRLQASPESGSGFLRPGMRC